MILKTGTTNIAAKIMFGGIVFPVYRNDNLQSICDRYAKIFPNDALGMAKAMDLLRKDLYNENGMSRELGLLRIAKQIPQPIYYAMKFLDDDFWHKSNLANYRHFAQICPRYNIGKQ